MLAFAGFLNVANNFFADGIKVVLIRGNKHHQGFLCSVGESPLDNKAY